MKENQIPPTYSFLNFFIFLSFQFSNINNFIFLFSGTERHTKLKLGPHMYSWLMYHVYRNDPKFSDRYAWANSADPGQTAPRGAV